MAYTKTTFVDGAAPGISHTELNKIGTGIEDAHNLASGAGVPSGVILPFGAAAAPAGFLLCNGAAIDRTTYADLFTAIGTTFGDGDGSTTFNVPDMRGRFPLGKTASGTGSTLGGTGGELDPTIDLAHTHTVASHSHSIDHGHSDTLGTSSAGSHTHAGPSHTHVINHTHSPTASGVEVEGGRHGSSANAGLYSRDDLAVAASSTSHSHGDGSYSNSGGPVTGTSASASVPHTHPINVEARQHTHTVTLPFYTGTSGPGGTEQTGSGGTHSHSVTGSVSGHSGSSGAAAPGTDSALSATESVPNAPFLSLTFIIKT